MAWVWDSLGAERALLLQLPVPEDGGGRRDGVDGAGERLRRAILVGVNGGQQCVLADLGGDWRGEQQVTPPANGSASTRKTHGDQFMPGTVSECNTEHAQGHAGKR